MTKVDSTGATVYSTYLGGNANDYLHAIAANSSGNAYVTGYTTSSDFPTQTAFQGANAGGEDGYVTELNTAGSALVYSTYLGGSSDDRGYGIALDSTGNAFVGGHTASTDFPVQNAFQSTNAGSIDAFATKVAAAGTALAYSTYLGGGDDDYGQGIAVDAMGEAYVTGYTTSSNFPVVNAFQPMEAGNYDAFVTSFRPAGASLAYSSFLGGSGPDFGIGIGVDAAGNATVGGGTNSGDFPTTNPVQSTIGGGQDAFVTKVPYLPTAVEVRAFTAVRDGRSVRLRWTTGSEADVAGFRVLRNGARLTGLLRAHGGALGHGYGYVDQRPGVHPV